MNLILHIEAIAATLVAIALILFFIWLVVDFNRRTNFALSNSAAGHPPGYRTETGDTPDPGAPAAFGPSGPGAFAKQQRERNRG